jgi:hypothetical protein
MSMAGPAPSFYTRVKNRLAPFIIVESGLEFNGLKLAVLD